MTTWIDSNQIRQKFLDYFKAKGHEVVPSSSLVPINDPTLLFTNAGMVQFKETFLGAEKRPYDCATTSQRCVRAGGKHNDLDQVGYTKRHHTFFEMLGNFSFGAYFKREAIRFAWNFLTEELQIPADRLWVTVYKDDKESEDIWFNEMGIDQTRFSRCGEKDNFWSMGDTGPCGPCTEIFYDHGPEIPGGPPGSPDEDADRYVEIWNLVFMQYNRDINGKLNPLPKPCVDTGMGLERVAAVVQGVHDNYDIDIFQRLMQSLSQFVDCKDFSNQSMRVIADHIRSCAFLIADGVMPSNEGRGYVLRRIIRRAVRHGFKLGQNESFFHKLVAPLVDLMGDAYPYLKSAQPLIEQVIEQEEHQFSKTLGRGLKILDEEINKLPGTEIPGHVVFQLYDTYGFPPDLTADIARERQLTLDYPGFEQCMNEQRRQSHAAQQFSMDEIQQLHIPGETEFSGYEKMHDEGVITTLLQDYKPVSQLEAGQFGIVVLDRTPFYAESGGQVGDVGYLYADSGSFRVQDTRKKGSVYLHYGEVMKGSLQVEGQVHAEVDESRRDTVLNHSATHLLHEALRRVLGDHVIQKGSLVEAKRLRFDFSHPKALSREQLHAIEHLVNQQIRANVESHVHETTLDDAKEEGALALFGEKYAERIRVVTMGEFSKEVCGGTHVRRSGDIGLFKITSEAASAAGIRRIEAVTGNEALRWIERGEEQLESLAAMLKTNRDEVLTKFSQVIEQNRELGREINRLKQKMANQESGSLAQQAKTINDIHLLAAELGEVDRDTLRTTVDQLKQQLGKAAVVLASTVSGKVILVAGVTKNCLDYFNATELLNQVASKIGGKGGGRPDMAQGGGDNPENLTAALAELEDWVREQVTAKQN